jgi:hypothetical protein
MYKFSCILMFHQTSDVTQSNKNLRSLSESWCAKLCEGATSFVAALWVRQIRTFVRINPNPHCGRIVRINPNPHCSRWR